MKAKARSATPRPTSGAAVRALDSTHTKATAKRPRPLTQVTLLSGGTAYFASLIAVVEGATESVFLETYIFDFFGMGAKVAMALVQAAERGVSVRVLVDGVGTPRVPAAWAERFSQSGVQFVQYSPLGRLGLLIPSRWRRLHRKLCVIDGQTAYCGGVNILDDWFDPNHGALAAPRFDFGVKITGPMVLSVTRTMDVLWRRTQAAKAVRAMKGKTVEDTREALLALAQTSTRGQHPPLFAGDAQQKFQLLLRDNVRNRRTIERAYLSAIGRAQHDITLANAYFLPGKALRRALAKAVQRGVRVRVLLQGRYEYFMQYHAARAVYQSLLADEVEIYEYEPSFLHAKVAVVDAATPDSWVTIGSSNLDPLSLLLAREANITVHSSPIASQLLQELEHAMSSQARQIKLEEFVNRPWLEQVRNRLAYALMRMALFLTGKRY